MPKIVSLDAKIQSASVFAGAKFAIEQSSCFGHKMVAQAFEKSYKSQHRLM